LYVITQVGLPSEGKKGYTCPPNIRASRTMILEELEALKVAAEKENKIIFFQPIPTFEDLPEPPAAAILMAPTAYEVPALPVSGPIIFTYDANLKPSLLTKMSSFKVF